MIRHTRTHVVDATCKELINEFISCNKTKVYDGERGKSSCQG